jgi:DNA replicative helicase MCM subunit Mcm2 (Cdc46/Mcm family)
MLVFINGKQKIKKTQYQCSRCGVTVNVETDIDEKIVKKTCFSCDKERKRRRFLSVLGYLV